MKAGATSSKKPVSRQEQIPLRLRSIGKLNWKGEKRTLCGIQRLRIFLRQIVRDKTGFQGHARCHCSALIQEHAGTQRLTGNTSPGSRTFALRPMPGSIILPRHQKVL